MKKMSLVALMSFLYVNLVIYSDAFTCPENFIQGSDGTCCKPKQCSENQGFRLCSNTDSPGYDECYDCPIGTHNPNPPIDTTYLRFSIEMCTKIDCNCLPEAELQNREECEKTGHKVCVCKRWKRYYGRDPGACQGPVNNETKIQKIRQKGFELKILGEIDLCEKGFFKDKSDDTICIPYTRCPNGYITVFNGSATQNRECQKMTTTTLPDTTTSVQPVTTSQTVTVHSLIAQPGVTNRKQSQLEETNRKQSQLEETNRKQSEHSQNRSVSEKVIITAENTTDITEHDPHSPGREPEKDEGKNSFLVVIISISVVLGVIALIGAICCIRKRRKRKQPCPRTGVELQGEVENVALTLFYMQNVKEDDNIEKNHPSDEVRTTVITEEESLLVGKCDKMDSRNGIDKKKCDGKHDTVTVPQTDLAMTRFNGTCTPQHGDVQNKPFHTGAEQNIKVCRDDCTDVKRMKVETQKSDSSKVVKMSEPCKEPNDMDTEEDSFTALLPDSVLCPPSNPHSQHSLGSLKSNGEFKPLYLASLDTDYPNSSVTALSPTDDSDYGSGPSKNDDHPLCIGSCDSLHVSSLQSREGEPGRIVNNQENLRNQDKPKLVMIVAPYRKDETKEIPEALDEETHFKTP
ncbi:uncharacterized protein LOC125651869 isoform X5 [Ostrea edulis]|uniref:uncharacterized protein LOC125651869 isoform X5 n=1 Tax=Ostrea edulis TaxID=37623 RepID=UPI0024AEF039|nr:uncharacterized protein LOC125651869 isoform X5 [Ostrea edulis]